jgi:CDP-6-deoxy-D-xylo-4-hexulose-3-dehydrase
MIARALGNPFRADLLADVCQKNGIWLIEDCCDALGARIGNASVGTFGQLATCSFYPAHHITMGEGGAVLTNDPILAKLALSFRDWGRDCWCPPAASDTCGIRFNWKLGDLPKGYDHKYIYSHLGYNLKTTDFQASIGLAQLQRLEGFIRIRRENHAYLDARLRDLGLDADFVLPKATPGTDPSWFGYFLHLRDANAERRLKIIKYLEEKKVGTRLLFGGNLTKQPAFQGVDYRIHGSLENSDAVMNGGFWIGIWPGLKSVHLDYMAETLAVASRQ